MRSWRQSWEKFYDVLGSSARRCGFDAFEFGARAAEVVESNRFFHPTFIQVVADFLALEADEIEAIDALVDFLAVEHSSPELIDADAEEIFVVLFYFAPAGFVTWKIFVFRLVVAAVVDIVGGAVLGRPAGAFLFCPWHFTRSKLPGYFQRYFQLGRVDRRRFGLIS